MTAFTRCLALITIGSSMACTLEPLAISLPDTDLRTALVLVSSADHLAAYGMDTAWYRQISLDLSTNAEVTVLLYPGKPFENDIPIGAFDPAASSGVPVPVPQETYVGRLDGFSPPTWRSSESLPTIVQNIRMPRSFYGLRTEDEYEYFLGRDRDNLVRDPNRNLDEAFLAMDRGIIVQGRNGQDHIQISGLSANTELGVAFVGGPDADTFVLTGENLRLQPYGYISLGEGNADVVRLRGSFDTSRVSNQPLLETRGYDIIEVRSLLIETGDGDEDILLDEGTRLVNADGIIDMSVGPGNDLLCADILTDWNGIKRYRGAEGDDTLELTVDDEVWIEFNFFNGSLILSRPPRPATIEVDPSTERWRIFYPGNVARIERTALEFNIDAEGMKLTELVSRIGLGVPSTTTRACADAR